jgi:hypothetical protein
MMPSTRLKQPSLRGASKQRARIIDIGDGLAGARVGYGKCPAGGGPLAVDIGACLQQSAILDSGQRHTKSVK